MQSTFPNSDNLMELLLAIDAAKRASAAQIIAVGLISDGLVRIAKGKPRVSGTQPSFSRSFKRSPVLTV